MTGRLGWGPRASAASTLVTSRSSPARAASPASSCWLCEAPWGQTGQSATQSTSTPSIPRLDPIEVTRNINTNWPQGHAPTILVPILSLDPLLITWNFTIGSKNHDNTRLCYIYQQKTVKFSTEISFSAGDSASQRLDDPGWQESGVLQHPEQAETQKIIAKIKQFRGCPESGLGIFRRKIR